MRRAAAVLLLALASAASAQDGVRREMAEPLTQARVAIAAKEYDDALRFVDAAAAMPNLSPYESLVIDQMRGSALTGKGDYAGAAAAFERVLDAQRIPADEQLPIMETLIAMYQKLNDEERVQYWFGRYRSAGGKAITAVPDAEDAAAVAKRIDAAEQAHRAPEEADLQRAVRAAIETKSREAYLLAMEKLVRWHPKPVYWSDLIEWSCDQPELERALDRYRLMRAAGVGLDLMQVDNMAGIALIEQLPAEAKAVVDEGFARGVLGTAGYRERDATMRARVEKEYAEERASIASRDADAEISTGDNLVRQGLRYVLYGDKDKGLAMIGRGLAKQPLQHADTTLLAAGYAYWLAGDRAKALAAFAQVKGDDGSASLARLWTLLLAPASVPNPKMSAP